MAPCLENPVVAATHRAGLVLRASMQFYFANSKRAYGSSFMAPLVRAYAMFGSASPWVQESTVGRLTPGTEAAFHDYYLDFLTGTAIDYTNETDWGVNVRRDSENIDTMRRTTVAHPALE